MLYVTYSKFNIRHHVKFCEIINTLSEGKISFACACTFSVILNL